MKRHNEYTPRSETMKTSIFTKKEVELVLTPPVANEMVEKAFMAYGDGQVEMPAKSYLNFKQGDLRAMPAYLFGDGFHIAGIKSVNVHPGNGRVDLPTVMAVVILTDPDTGFPLAILDGTYLTNMRTGAAGAIASKLLSRENSKIGGFVGCGSQARTLLACTMEVRKLRAIKVWERHPENRSARQFCHWAETSYQLETITSPDIDEVTTNVDILFTSTPSRAPIVHKVSPGTHINAIGADAEGKQEISPEIVTQAKVVIDDWTQAAHSGEINVPIRNKVFSRDHIYAELGEIAVKKKPGRTSDHEITLFDSTGLAIQDISCAYRVYTELKEREDILRVAFF
jgi:alanine dehydrogenase